MIRTLVSALAVLGLLLSSPAHAGPTIDEFRHGVGEVRQYQTIYLMGVLAGYGGANAALIDRQEKPLYCEPARLSITASQIVRIVEDFLEAHTQLTGDNDLSIITLFALEDAFPCEGGQMPFTGPLDPEP